MAKISLLSVIFALFNVFQMPVFAVTAGPITSLGTSPAAFDVVRIERGGTINSIDLKKKTMRVDGVSWSLSNASVVGISATMNRLKPGQFDSSAGLSDLKPGMAIRFVTVKKNVSNQAHDQVLEIVVTHSPTSRP